MDSLGITIADSEYLCCDGGLTTATDSPGVAVWAADDSIRLECLVWRAVAAAGHVETVGETQSVAGWMRTALRRRRGDDVLPTRQLHNSATAQFYILIIFIIF